MTRTIGGTVLAQRFHSGRYLTRVSTAIGELMIDHPSPLETGAAVSVAIDDELLTSVS